MDSSWQGKCGSAFQPSAPTMASSSSKEARDQMEMNSGHCFYPYAGQDLRFQIHGRKPDPTFPSFNSFSSCSSTLTDLSSSFLALLSEPATLSQFGIQELSNPQLFNPTTGMANQICSVAGTPVGHQVPLASMRPSKIISYQNPQGGNVLYPTVSSSAKACPSFGSSGVFEGSYPAVNTSRQGSDLAETTIHHTVFGNGKEKDFHSLEEGVHSLSLVNGVKIQNVNHQMLQKVPVEVKCFASNNSSNSNSGSPRVFCLDKSGNLLLSNTGLLGILCSCHCIHMSVSRFCEHSGLWDANPGDSIRMGSGETIAQWRKLYFQRCGIRIPEDQSGWEWPERLSLTANLMKSAVPMSNMLKHSECSNLVGPSDDLLRSGWPLGDVSPNNFLVNKSLVTDDRHNKQQRSVKDCNKRYLDGFVGNSRNNSCDLGDNYMTERPTSRCLTMPKFAARGPGNICQSLYLNSVVENGGPSTTHPALQDKKNLVRNFAVSRDEDVHEISVIDKVASSSIELKLGQPMQQSHRPGNPVTGPLCYNTTVNPLKSFPQGQNIHNEEESGGHVPDAVGLSNYTRRREQDCLNYANYAHHNTNGNKAKSSADSLFGRNTLPEGSSQSIATKLLNVNEHVVRETQHYHSANCNSSDAPVDDGNILDRKYVNHGSRICKLADMGKGIGYLTGNSCVQAASVSKLQKWMENTSCSTEVVKGNNLCVSPPMHDESRYSMCSSNMPPDASDAENFLESLQKVHYRGSSGYTDRVFFRPKCSPGGYMQNLSSKGIPMGSAPSAPNPTPEFLAAMAHQDSNGTSSYSLDDSLTMLTSGQILELCKKQHVMSSLGNNLEQEKSSDTYNVKIQHSFVEPSILEEQRSVPNLIRKHDVSEMAMKMKLDHSVPPSTKLKDDKKVTSMTGFSRWCNNSASNLGVPQKYDEFGTHHQLSQNPPHNKQSSFRLSGSQSSIYSAAHGSCYRTTHCYQCDCSCVARTNCLGRKCNTIGGNCPNSLRNQTGNMSCKTPILIASPCVNDHSVPKENAISFNQCGRINGQLPKNVNCGGSQWNDFTSQVKGFSELACIKQSANMLDGTRHELFKFGDTAAKYSNGTVHAADSFKELDVSNISSGCSTPAVSQASIDVANVDSSTNVGDTGCTDNLAVDEGSTIDKCWSSDDAIESDRSSNFYGCKSKQRRHTSSKVTSHNSTRNLLEEVKLMDFLAWKKGQNLKQAGNVHWKSNQSQETEKSFKPVKRKREIKLKKLDSISGTEVPLLDGEGSECGRISDWHCLSKNVQLGSCGPDSSRAPVAHSIKINPDHENSKMTVTKALAHERDFFKNSDAGDCDNDHEIEVNCANSCEKPGISGRKKLRSYQTAGIRVQLQSHESTEAVGERTVMYDSENCTKTYSSQHVSYCDRKAKPVVCGEYGEITNGNMGEDLLERVKIVSLDWVLKTAKRCSLPKRHKSEPTSSKVLNRTTFGRSNACHDKSSILTKGRKISSDALMCEEVNNHISMEERDDTSTDDDEQYGDDFSMVGKKCHGSGKGRIIQETTPHARLRRKHKETRKRSLYELMLRGNNPDSKLVLQKKFKCAPKMKWEDILQNSDEIPDHKSREVRREQRHNSVIECDLCCCVCGSSNEDEVDRLLECCQCSIRVHQACYGVSKVPKGPWYCRPCRTNSKNIVCVLCGYGGGAMTRAFQCHTSVKSLLKAWNLESECRPKNAILSGEALPDEQSMLHASVSIPGNNSFPTVRPINSKLPTSSICKMDAYNQFETSENSLSNVSDLKVHNSITEGVCDSTVKQWVHMVCGLLTAGTRCPNVDTMSAFDVSDVSYPRENMVCSLCNRRGGSCIQCRVANCSSQFHIWCAHQKGLLQTEAEGVDDENVGFYGRCMLHAIYATNESPCDAKIIEADHSEKKEASCARTEGYKGRKRDGFWHNINSQSKGKGGCFVHQEQLNAWIHINGLKSCANGIFKLPMLEKEYDYRKEYARYGQAKGWKHLVVYKSGIHALGLYTSRFISRREMVVEYIGEVVGLRVADKREKEYQSGRRLQYKSACYFFRVDKEHIIDATRKGGIARFVNHSCLPNCIARVISVKNEKKVVFFAERDIYPGEEITYDYHFNHEDEGKKIPCFCNAKNCRRYLN